MADETDFIDLYRKLRVPAHCALADFKQAYRRHVAQWHPDRRPGNRADALAAARLQRLTAQYGAAMEFHKRHGRLPGAAQPQRMRAAGAETAAVAEGVVPPVPRPAGQRPAGRALRTRWMLLAAAVGIAAIVWSLTPAARVPEVDDADDTRMPVTATVHALAELRPGMGRDEVLAVEGEPTRRGGDQWEYGPSWVRFEGDGLSDWYSSPLRPLHVVSARAQR